MDLIFIIELAIVAVIVVISLLPFSKTTQQSEHWEKSFRILKNFKPNR